MSFLLEGSVKVERESVRVEVVAEYFNISTFYVLSYLQPNKIIFRVLIGFIREFFLLHLYSTLCVMYSNHTKRRNKTFNNFRPKTFYQNFQNLIFIRVCCVKCWLIIYGRGAGGYRGGCDARVRGRAPPLRYINHLPQGASSHSVSVCAS